MSDARHEQAVTLLTGLERFVRLVVEREIPLSQANPANLTPAEKSPLVIGTSKPYTGLYSANSYMANRPGYTAFRRSIDADRILSTSPTSKMTATTTTSPVSAPKVEPPPPPPAVAAAVSPTAAPSVNGMAKLNGEKPPTPPPPPPQPAPRSSINKQQQQQQEQTGGEEPSSIQVPKPITNEDFQAMIPAHFLHHSSPSPDSGGHSHHHQASKQTTGPSVTVTIKQPESCLTGEVSLPPAPTAIGKVTETITKSTLTETVVTRVTDNQLLRPVIIEVSVPDRRAQRVTFVVQQQLSFLINSFLWPSFFIIHWLVFFSCKYMVGSRFMMCRSVFCFESAPETDFVGSLGGGVFVFFF